MKNSKLINYLCLSGILGLVFYLLHDIIGALNYPEYNFMAQAVSDLTATDAPSYEIARILSGIYGLFSCLCSIAMIVLMKKEEDKVLRWGVYLFAIMNFVSAIGYTLFPLSSAGYDGSIQSIMHVYVVTTIVVLLSIISLVLLTISSFFGIDKHKLLGIFAVVSLVLMFIGAMFSTVVPKEIFGIFERLSTYSAVVFTAVLGIFGFKRYRE